MKPTKLYRRQPTHARQRTHARTPTNSVAPLLGHVIRNIALHPVRKLQAFTPVVHPQKNACSFNDVRIIKNTLCNHNLLVSTRAACNKQIQIASQVQCKKRS